MNIYRRNHSLSDQFVTRIYCYSLLIADLIAASSSIAASVSLCAVKATEIIVF